jgi:hypothetical protein
MFGHMKDPVDGTATLVRYTEVRVLQASRRRGSK